MKDAEAQVKKAFDKANSEIESVFQESMALESQGELDAAAKARIEAHLHEISTGLDKELDKQIAEVKASYAAPNRRVLPKRFRVPAIAMLFFVLIGSILEFTVGDAFIFAGANDYRRAIPWLLSVVVPLIAVGLFLLEKANHGMRAQFPTWVIRWLVMFPLTIAMCSAALVVSPLGWASVLGWVAGTPTEHLEAIVISVDSPSRYSRSGECDQYANLEFRAITARVCIEGLMVGATPQKGDKVALSGRFSSLGLFIESIRGK
ncbi:MAG: hypothetical protein HZC23_01885 [Rhodocyclales bacterium]|nr:hypothetical protein [Rhodocyclales bacterium]